MSVTDIKAAIGDGPAPAPVTGGEPAVRPRGDPAEPFVRGALLAYPEEKILWVNTRCFLRLYHEILKMLTMLQ